MLPSVALLGTLRLCRPVFRKAAAVVAVTFSSHDRAHLEKAANPIQSPMADAAAQDAAEQLLHLKLAFLAR